MQLPYLRARWSNPKAGRFLERDSLQGALPAPGSLHRYASAQHNPLAYHDPSGHWAWPVWGNGWMSLWTSGWLPLASPLAGDDGYLLGFGPAIATAAGALATAQGLLPMIQQRANPIISVAVGVPEGRGAFGLSHILLRHFQWFGPRDRSFFFTTPYAIPELLSTAEQLPPYMIGPDRFARVVDLGSRIGWDYLTRAVTSRYTVITNTAEELITMFPGFPYRSYPGPIFPAGP